MSQRKPCAFKKDRKTFKYGDSADKIWFYEKPLGIECYVDLFADFNSSHSPLRTREENIKEIDYYMYESSSNKQDKFLKSEYSQYPTDQDKLEYMLSVMEECCCYKRGKNKIVGDKIMCSECGRSEVDLSMFDFIQGK